MPRKRRAAEELIDPSKHYMYELERAIKGMIEYEITVTDVTATIWLERTTETGYACVGKVLRKHFDTIEEAKLKALEYAFASLFRSTRITPMCIDTGANPYSMSLSYYRRLGSW